jgi:cation diffusion facilitator family transporter
MRPTDRGLLMAVLLTRTLTCSSEHAGQLALLADTIHNFGDAATAIPLAIAFWFARKKPSERFTFGYGRVEDLAGVAIVLTILASAIIAGYESVERLLHPQEISYLGAVMAASIIGFVGNEAVAIFRIRIGQEIKASKVGVEIKEVYLTSGDDDLLIILDTPNGDNVAKFALALGALGNVRTRTARAWPQSEFQKLISELP